MIDRRSPVQHHATVLTMLRRATSEVLRFWAVGAGLFTVAAITMTLLLDPTPTMRLGALALLPGLTALTWHALAPLWARDRRRKSYSH